MDEDAAFALSSLIMAGGFVLAGLLNVLMGLFFIARKRLAVGRSTWLFGVMVATLGTLVISQIVGNSIDDRWYRGLDTLSVTLGVMATALPWGNMRGYVIVGVSEAHMREAVSACANRLGFAVELTENTWQELRLRRDKEEFIVYFAAGLAGMSVLKCIRMESRESVRAIARTLREELRWNPGPFIPKRFYAQFVVGLGLIIFGAYVGFSFGLT